MEKGKCRLCETNNVDLSKHHLVPKSLTKRINPNHAFADRIIKVCDKCHKQLHDHFVEHIFTQRKYTPLTKFDYLRLQAIQDFVKENHPKIWEQIKNKWKKYLKEELKKLESEDCSF